MTLASIDLLQLQAGDENAPQLVDELLHSCATYGFVKFVGHGIPDERLQRLFEWSREFFSWPDQVKQTANRPKKGPYRGYAAVGQEQIGAISGFAKGVRDPSQVEDVKESFDLGPSHDLSYPTPWPASARSDEFRAFMNSFFADCIDVHNRILAIFEQALCLRHGELRDLCSEGNGEVRMTHYPAIPVAQLKTGSKYRIAEHSDVGILTLLFQDSVGGLEVEDPERPGSFVPAESGHLGEMIVNVGDTLQRWTSKTLRSTNHRVLYPQNHQPDDVLPPRYSVGFFGKANASASMAPLASLVPTMSGEPHDVEARSAQDYYNFMHERTSVAVPETKVY